MELSFIFSKKMNISQRINARKVLLSCLYEIFFADKIFQIYEKIEEEEQKQQNDESEKGEITISGDWGVFEKKIEEEIQFKDSWKLSKEEYGNILSRIKEKKSESIQEILDYQLEVAYDAWKVKKTELIANYTFEEWKEKEIDREYLKTMLEKVPQYREIVQEKVNQYVTSFTYEEMDLMDQVIFLLGYTEAIEFHTPKEVLINEMVELAKRYSRDGASKVIHGIFHHLIEN